MRVQTAVDFSVIFFTAMAMALVAGCAGSEATPSGTCSTDADCKTSETCENGLCVSKGMSCSNNMDCPPGFMCIDGLCTNGSVTDGDTVDNGNDAEMPDLEKDTDEIPADGDDDQTEADPDPEADPEIFEPEIDMPEEDVTEQDAEIDGDVSEEEPEAETEAEIDGDSEEAAEIDGDDEEAAEVEDEVVEAEEEVATEEDVEPETAEETEPEAEMELEPEPEVEEEAEAEAEVEINCDEVGYQGVCINNVLYYCISGNVRTEDCGADSRVCEFWEQAGIHACLGSDGAVCGNEGDPVCAEGYECQNNSCVFVGDCSPGEETCTDGNAFVCGDDHYWSLKETCADGAVCRMEDGAAICAEPVDGDEDTVEDEQEIDDIDTLDDVDSVDDVESVEEEEEEGCGDITYNGICEDNVLIYCQDDHIERVDCGAAGMTCQDVDGQGDNWCVSNEGGACNNPPPIYCRNDLICYQGTCDPADACNQNGWLPDGVTGGSTTNGTNQFNPSCVSTNARGNEMIYMLHVNAREWVEVEVNPTGSGDPVLYYMTSCDEGTCPLGVDDNGSGSSESFALGSENPAEVFVGVDKYNSGTYGYTVEVTRHSAQTCADVTTISNDQTVNGSTRYQFNDYTTTAFGSCSDGDGASGNGHDAIYRIVRPADLEAHITVDPNTSNDVVLFLLDACEPSVASCGYCRDYEVSGYAETVIVDVDGPTEFYLVVDGYSADEGYDFSMDVSFREPDSGCAAMGRGNADFLDIILLWVIAVCGATYAWRRRRKVRT